MNRVYSLDTAWAGRKTIHFDTIDSTNEEARRYARAFSEQEQGDDAEGLTGHNVVENVEIAEEPGQVGTDFHGTLFVSEEQTAGKGRRGRVWQSPKGGNLYCSLLLKPECPPDAAPRLTLLMGLAVAEAVREVTGLDALIKWPNDVVVEGRKICGILTEMDLASVSCDHKGQDYPAVSCDHKGQDYPTVRDIIIGLGINIARREYPEELRDKAADLETLMGEIPDKNDLLLHVMRNFEIIYGKFIATGDLTAVRDEYQKLLVNMDRRVRVLDPQREYEGVAIGIDRDGQLLVQKDDMSVTTVFAGEVSVRGVLGYI